MSTTEWTNPNTGKGYPIGTIGYEYNSILFKAYNAALDAVSSIFPLMNLGENLLMGAWEKNGAWCPTYGLWAGAGWASGSRYSEAQNPLIKWTTEPFPLVQSC